MVSSSMQKKDLRETVVAQLSDEEEERPGPSVATSSATATLRKRPAYDPYDFRGESESEPEEEQVPPEEEKRKEPNFQAQSTVQEPKEHEPKRRSKKRVPLGDLIRDNQMKYNKFISKKVPKLLKTLGVSSSSDSD